MLDRIADTPSVGSILPSEVYDRRITPLMPHDPHACLCFTNNKVYIYVVIIMGMYDSTRKVKKAAWASIHLCLSCLRVFDV